MLGVDLREHHQLDVGRIAPQPRKALEQVVHLFGRQRKSQPAVGLFERCAAAAEGYPVCGPRRRVLEQPRSVRRVEQHFLGHAVEQHRRNEPQPPGAERRRRPQPVGDTALDAAHRGEPAHLCDIGCLARPGRDGAGARHHH